MKTPRPYTPAVATRLHGAIAAVVTPLRDAGRHLDEEAYARLVGFVAAGGIDGALVCGTTGEGLLLSVDERRRAVELVIGHRSPTFQVAVHAGAQTTSDTVALAAHALESGADAVAVIAPPFFPLDEHELFLHLRAAADACEPLPFYVYEFARRSGYAIPIPVIERLRVDTPNLAGLKVSDTPIEAVEPYLLDGVDVFIGSEPLVLPGMELGAVGAVSGLATAFPEIVAQLVHDRDPGAHQQVTALRSGLAGIPFHAALKHLLVRAGVLVHDDVRAPLRTLTDDERMMVESLA
jgi:dihydrodipicolinate synthase/N-acetylneuraminate lyase